MVWTPSRKTNCLPEHPGRYTKNCNLTTFLFHSSVSIILSRAIHNSRGQMFNTTSRYQFSIWTYTEWKSERRIRIWLQLIIMSAKAPKMTSWNQIQPESRGMELQKLPGLSKPFCPSFQIRYAFGLKRYVYVMRGLRKHMARFLGLTWRSRVKLFVSKGTSDHSESPYRSFLSWLSAFAVPHWVVPSDYSSNIYLCPPTHAI